jgi:hypothetical protein
VLERVSDGQNGSFSARVVQLCPPGATDCTTFAIDDSPATVINPTQGHTYTATVWVKADTGSTGKRVDLILRERGGATADERSYNTPITTLSGTWKKLTVTHTVLRNDRTSLDLYVLQRGAPANPSPGGGDAFRVDNVTMVKN